MPPSTRSQSTQKQMNAAGDPIGSGTNEQQGPQILHETRFAASTTASEEASSAANIAPTPTGAAATTESTAATRGCIIDSKKRDHPALRSHPIPRGMQNTFSSTMDTGSTTNTPTRTTSSMTDAVDETATVAQRGWVVDVLPEKKDHRALRAYQRQLEMLEGPKTKQAGASSTPSSTPSSSTPSSAPNAATNATSNDLPDPPLWFLNPPPPPLKRGIPRPVSHSTIKTYSRRRRSGKMRTDRASGCILHPQPGGPGRRTELIRLVKGVNRVMTTGWIIDEVEDHWALRDWGR